MEISQYEIDCIIYSLYETISCFRRIDCENGTIKHTQHIKDIEYILVKMHHLNFTFKCNPTFNNIELSYKEKENGISAK